MRLILYNKPSKKENNLTEVPFMMFFLLLVIITVIFFISKYNRLQGLAHQARRFNGDIMVSLQKRADLANRLIDIAREYGLHEKLAHITISNNYKEAMRETNEALTRINALSQNFPQLRANESYNLLMSELSEIETNIQKARELYNMAAGNYNTFRVQIPQSFFAAAVGFKEAPYFDTANLDAIREFRTDDGEMLKKALTGTVDRTMKSVKKGVDGLDKVLNKKDGGNVRDDAEASPADTGE